MYDSNNETVMVQINSLDYRPAHQEWDSNLGQPVDVPEVGWGRQYTFNVTFDEPEENNKVVANYFNSSKEQGIYLKRVLYISEDTEDSTDAYVEAAQNRINSYLGDDILVFVSLFALSIIGFILLKRKKSL